MSTPKPPVFVSGETARKVFEWQAAVEALQQAYSRPLVPAAVPPRTIARGDKAWLRTLPAIPPGGQYFGAKLMGLGAGAGAPGLEYVIVLFDRDTGRIAAFLDANLITGYRTAATSAAALDRLAPTGPARLAILGSGLEASMHARAFAAVRSLSGISVFSPTPARRQAFADTLTRELGVPVRAVGAARDAMEGADIVLAAARSKGEVPILHGDWLQPDAVVVSIGSTVPEQRELDVSVVAHRDLIVCDEREEVLNHTGDMIAARAAGIAFEDKTVSLAELMSGACANLLQGSRSPMFKSVGGGLQDIVVAELVLRKAVQAGLATPLPIAFDTKH